MSGTTAYPNGRFNRQDKGWYLLPYAFDWQCVVEIAGKRPPFIPFITKLTTTLDTNPREVRVQLMEYRHCHYTTYDSVVLYYAENGGKYQGIRMTSVQGDDYSYTSQIPGCEPGTTITYYAEAYHYSGLIMSSQVFSYTIFKPTEKVLFISDANDLSPATADSLYFYGVPEKRKAHDFWAASYGPIFNELLDHYRTVIHVMGSGPVNKMENLGSIYKTWLDGAKCGSPRFLFISAQDYGYISNFADTIFPAGSFEHDYTGISKLGPQDIPSDLTGARHPWKIEPLPDYNGSIYYTYATFEADSLQLFYDPYGILAFPAWHDNLTPVNGAVVDFTDPDHNSAPVGIHYSDTNCDAAWRTIFWAFDWLALVFYDPADTVSKAHWGLTDAGNLLVAVLEWLDPEIIDKNEEIQCTPKAFSLKRIFPNPFNTTATISYNLPAEKDVEIRVFDLTGNQTATLFSGRQPAGSYSIVWNAGNLPSGIYFIELKAGNFRQIQKCALVK